MCDNKTIDKDAIIANLGTDKDDIYRFYVYALCEKTDKNELIPFYIGKGEGGRIWNHIDETEGMLKEIKDNYRKRNEAFSEEDIQKELNEKNNQIKGLLESNKLEHVIIKWGLTEQEAFMAESALINLLNMENYSFNSKKLTNVVNGHASGKEKHSHIYKTEAMTDKLFYDNCCTEPLEFGNIELTDKKSAVLFININDYYPKITHKDYEAELCDITRGCWRVDKKRVDKEKTYILPVYRNKIYGIYKVKKVTCAFDLDNYPHYPEEERSREKKILEKRKISWDEMSDADKEDWKAYLYRVDPNYKDEEAYFRNKYKNWIQRKLFVCSAPDNEEVIFKYKDREMKTEDIIGRLIKKHNKSIFVQYPTTYIEESKNETN